MNYFLAARDAYGRWVWFNWPDPGESLPWQTKVWCVVGLIVFCGVVMWLRHYVFPPKKKNEVRISPKMDLKFACPSCRFELTVDAAAIGQSFACPKCSTKVTVPASQPTQSSV